MSEKGPLKREDRGEVIEMILEKIQTDLKEAMKAKDEAKVSALRFLLAQIHNREIALRSAQGELLKDEEVIGILQKQAKERKESIEAFRQGERTDLVSKEQAELEILSKYLPQQLAPEELEKIVSQAISETSASGPADFGKVMGAVMAKVKGQVDGNIVAQVVKERLGN